MIRRKWYRNVSNADEETPAVPGKFIRTLKNKIYRYMTSISNILYINKLLDILTLIKKIIIKTLTWEFLIFENIKIQK